MSTLLERVSVVLETETAIVVSKPAGLLVHSDGRTDELSLCDWILREYPEIEGVGEPVQREGQPDIPRPGIVHRLDKETSGVLVIARTDEAFAHIKKQFKNREVTKEYDVFVHGVVDQREFCIDKPIGRSKGNFRRYQVPPYTRGETKKARTNFRLQATTDEASYLRAYPQTGRTHQIRVHLQSIHHPVVCDSLYSPDRGCLWGLDRHGLHACRITFRLPDGSQVAAEAALPSDLQQAREAFPG